MHEIFLPLYVMRNRVLQCLCIFAVLYTGTVSAQVDELPTEAIETQSSAVMFDGKILFSLHAPVGSFSPEERAAAVTKRLENLVNQEIIKPERFSVRQSLEGVTIIYDNKSIVSILHEDAAVTKEDATVLANTYIVILQDALSKKSLETHWRTITLKIVGFVVSFVIIIALLIVINRLFSILHKKILSSETKLLFRDNKYITIFKYISSAKERQFNLMIINLLKLLSMMLIIILVFPFILNAIPWTKGYAAIMFTYIKTPLLDLVAGIIDFIPNLFFIIVTFCIAFYVLKIFRYFAKEIERGRITIKGFYPDWAFPTFYLLKVLICAFVLIVIFPYLPGSTSPAFQGITIFAGVIISFGSSSAVSNIMAGIVMTYMRPFKVGDRVSVGGAIGDVTEKTLLVTTIRTPKNIDVIIPNAEVINAHIQNYTRNAENLGIILHTTVTIGYNVPSQKVEEALIKGALSVEGVEHDPKPFVLQTSLDDFYVSYEMNAYTKIPQAMTFLYSNLHKAIAYEMHAAGIEILSPHYSAIRDGNTIAVPPQNVPENYSAPSFHIDSTS